MISIVVAEHGKKLSDFIFSVLTKSFDVTYLCKSELKEAGNGKKLLLINSSRTIRSEKRSITVFGQSSSAEIPIGTNTTAIVSSENKRQLFELAGSNTPVITCGMNPKDTFTCTSMNDGSAVIALQRTLRDLFGNEQLPFEMPVKISETRGLYDEIVSVALLTLLGGY